SYVGGAGSCAGCGEGTALRMLCAATGSKFGDQWGLVAATGCNTVYTSTYPYNPYLVPWTNSLFENAPADSIGVRMRWDQMGWRAKPVWCIGGDGAMFDIGFQSLSRIVAHRMNIKVFVLDTPTYSHTGLIAAQPCTPIRLSSSERAGSPNPPPPQTRPSRSCLRPASRSPIS